MVCQYFSTQYVQEHSKSPSKNVGTNRCPSVGSSCFHLLICVSVFITYVCAPKKLWMDAKCSVFVFMNVCITKSCEPKKMQNCVFANEKPGLFVTRFP